MNKIFTLLTILLISFPLIGQEDGEYTGPPIPDDLNVLDMYVTENNDTLLIADLPLISVTSSRLFLDMSKYRRTRHNAEKVFPYAKRAVGLIKEIEKETAEIEKKRHRKKYLRHLEDELKNQFKSELKNLTTTQGKILVNMIERDTNSSFYDLLKGFKNPVTALFFQGIGKRYGYDLKDGYDPEEEWLLEKVILELEEEAAAKTEEG